MTRWKGFSTCLKLPWNRPSRPAHALRNYKGRCENVHGHNWKVRVVIEGEKLDATGMLVDFLDVKSLMGEIIDRIDHQFLNEIPPFDVRQSVG